MLKLTISEKGGGDRDLFFESGDVSVGRIQGNSVVLAKPNVSKRHATIQVRDGKVIVTDLKSTNGTYVNGRRISGPREVGPDDRIYVGDFTIRASIVDSSAGEETPPPAPPPEEVQRRATLAMPAIPVQAPARDAKGIQPIPPMPATEELSAEVPLDLDVEVIAPEPSPRRDTAPAARPVSPAMAAWKGLEAELGEVALDIAVEEAPAAAALTEPPAAQVTPPRPAPRTEPVPRPLDHSHPTALQHSTISRSRVSGFSHRPAAHAGAAASPMEVLRAVASRAAVEVFADVEPSRADFTDDEWAGLSERVMRIVDDLRRQNAIPPDADPFSITQEVLFDFAGLGPLEELLGDETVRGVFIDGIDRIFVLRGPRPEPSPRGFVDGSTFQRVLTKLLGLAGIPEPGAGPRIEGRLPDGTYMLVLRPPLASGGTAIVIERLSGGTLTLSDMVAAGVLDEAAARVVRDAVTRKRNLVVCGGQRSGKTAFMDALLRLLPVEERAVIVEARRELALSRPDVVTLSKDAIATAPGDEQVIPRLRPDVVVLADLGPRDADMMMRLAIAGQKGLMATMSAYSAADCLRRFELLAALANPAMCDETMRAAVRLSLDLVVVLGRAPDGRTRVVEIAEVDPESGGVRPAVVS